MPWSKLESQYTIPASATASVTQSGGGTASFTLNLTAGTYYLADLCAQLQDDLNTQAGGSTYSVGVSDDTDTSTGKVTITKSSAGTFTLAWTTSTGLRAALGFDDDLTPTASAFTGANASPHIWLPTCGRTDAALADGDDGWPVRLASVSVSSSGTVRSWVGAAVRHENVLAWESLRGYRTVASQESVVNESLETFWRASINLGLPVRYHKDRSDDATYNEFAGNPEAVATFRPERVIANHYGPNALWRARFGVYATGGSSAGAASWTPADLSPLAWWRSDLGITITGSGVSTWADQSGNGYDATQSTDSYRPTYATGQINGHPALTWADGPVSHLNISITPPSNASVIFVGKLTSGKTAGRKALGAASSATPLVYYQHPTSTRPALHYSGAEQNPGATAVNDGVWRALRWMWGSTNVAIAYDDGSDQTITRTGLTASGTWSYIGAGASETFDGQIAEVIIVSAELTAGQITSLNAYLSTRYGLW